MANKTTTKKNSNVKTAGVSASEKPKLLSQLQTAYYAIWSVVGLLIIVLVSIAVFGSGSWTENLHLSDTGAPTQQPTQQAPPQQPAGPTQDQLDCVADEVGQERLEELEQGGQPSEEESTVIQECLQP